MPIERRYLITRQMLRDEPKALFVFGDNIEERGLGGQAREMRGEPNAIGIPTKWKPDMSEQSFFRDEHFDAVVDIISARFGLLEYHLLNGAKVVFPEAGIGTGLADLSSKSPKIWALIQAHIHRLAKIVPIEKAKP